MKREIYRRYPIEERVALVERLLDRGVHAGSDPRWFGRQPGRCCLSGCRGPELAGPEGEGGASGAKVEIAG